MSEENVEIAKRIYAAWNRGGPTAASIYYDPDIEWQEAAEVLDADVVRGRNAVLAYLDEWIGLFGSTRVEVQELIPVDPEHLISVFRYQVQGSASGIAGEGDGFHVLGFRNGLLRSCRVFRTRAEALEAAGLRE